MGSGLSLSGVTGLDADARYLGALPAPLVIHVATALSNFFPTPSRASGTSNQSALCLPRCINENLSVQTPGPAFSGPSNLVFPRGHDWPAVRVDASTDDSSSTAKNAKMNGSGGQLTLQSPFVEPGFEKL